MAKTSALETRIINRVTGMACLVGAAVLLVAALLAWWAGTFAVNTVHNQLAAQKIYFPPKGDPSFSPAEFPDLQKYAGQAVDNGDKARAYADGFIGRHLAKIGGGKTYAEISAASMANPTDKKLQTEKQLLFQGETLRGLLLGDAYAYGTIGHIAKIAAAVCLVLAGLLGAVALSKIRYVL